MPTRASGQIKDAERLFSVWMGRRQTDKLSHQIEELPLRRDMVTLLPYVRDNNVVGTQGAGNMPMKAVREVTARFVNPPKLEAKVGDYVDRIRNETELWPLYFPRILAEVGRLLKVGSARRWRLTPKGESFLEAAPMLQLPILLAIWWHKVNWLFAYPYTGMGDSLPPFFKMHTLDNLLALPSNTRISFEKFADALIMKTGLTWGAKESRFATTALRGSIARMVIFILVAFGAIEPEYKKGTSLLAAFEITPLGKALLEAVAVAAQRKF